MQISEDALFARIGRQQIELELLREKLEQAESLHQEQLATIGELTAKLKAAEKPARGKKTAKARPI